MLRRFFAVFLTLTLILGICPLSVWAVETEEIGPTAETEERNADAVELTATEDWIEADWIVGGRICFDSSTGTITDCDSSVTEVDIPATISGVSVTTIGDYAFAWCSSLTSINIPNSVTSIGYGAFMYCSSLTSISIPNSVTSIGDNAFAWCSSLTSISIPSSVTSIGYDAFSRCWSLKDVYYSGSAEQCSRVSMGSGNSCLTSATIHYNCISNKVPGISTTSGTGVQNDYLTVKFDAGLYATEEASQKKTDISFLWNAEQFQVNSSVNPNLAIAGLVLSANAYDSSLEKETLKKMGFVDSYGEKMNIEEYDIQTDFITGAPAHFFIASHKDQYGNTLIVISIRGSANGADWVSNIVQNVPGFYDAAREVGEYLTHYAEERNIDSSSVKLFITGHSRGGAIANILGASINHEVVPQSRVFCYTYACPNLASKTPTRGIFNFVLDGDPVPSAPPVIDDILCGRDQKYGETIPLCVNENSTFFSQMTGGLHTDWLSKPVIMKLFGNQIVTGYPDAMLYHTPGAYMSCLLDMPLRSFILNYHRKISIACPVDVQIFDHTGNLLGKIENDVPDSALLDRGIYVVVENHEKYIYYPEWMEVDLKLIGTDTGTMEYSVETVDGDTIIEEKTFENVALTDGKEMSTAVGNDTPVEDIQLFKTSNGEVSKEILTDGTEQDVVLITFETMGGDTIQGKYVEKGAKVAELPTAVCPGYQFDGWCTDAGCTKTFDMDTVLNASITLYAKYREAYDVYARYKSISYDGQAVSVGLAFDYCNVPSKTVTALYQDGRMLTVGRTSSESGAETAQVTIPISGLVGTYELKSFSVSSDGAWKPISEVQEISFYAN